MAYEITTNQATGLTLTARLVLAGAYVGAVIALTESGTVPGHYTGTPPSGTAAAYYGVLVFNGATRIADGGLDCGAVGDGNTRASEPPAVSEAQDRWGLAIIKN